MRSDCFVAPLTTAWRKKRKVIIIGGGIAGLAAASKLQDCEVTLLESRARFGGRIHTVDRNDSKIELGAEFVHGRNKALLELLRKAHLETRPASEKNQMWEDGKLQPVEVWEEFGKLIERVEPNKTDIPFSEFIETQPLPDRDRKMLLEFATGFNAARADELSTHSLKRADFSAEQIDGDKQARVEKGYGELVDFLVEQNRAQAVDLVVNSVVQAVRWQRGAVEVEYLHEGVGKVLAADAAIVTLPLGVLKSRSVTFQPALTDKEEAIAGLKFGNALKINLVFRECWWPEADFGFIHAVDELLPTWWSHAGRPMLTGWAGGEKADAVVNLPQDELQLRAIEILSRIFQKKSSDIQEQLVAAEWHNWTHDPHTRGAYTSIPVNGLILPKLLAAPVEQTLFFAGEATATDAQLGTVFAALETGYRAANELSESSGSTRGD